MPSSYGRRIATAAFVLALTFAGYTHAATSTPAELLLQALLPPASSATPVTITPDYNRLPQAASDGSASLTPINAILPGASAPPTPPPVAAASSTALSAAKAALLKILYAELATLEAELAALDTGASAQTSTPPPATSCTPLTITRSLALGSIGADVSSLQQFLQRQGYYTYPSITGYFGAVTQKAVEAFQGANGIEAIGSVGPITRAKITALTNACATTGSANTGTLPNVAATATTTATSTAATTPIAPVIPSLTYGGGGEGGGGGGGGSTPTPDTTPPTVSMTAPSSGATVSGTSVTLTATASDNVAVADVQFSINGTDIGSAITSSPYVTTWDSTGVSDGTYTLYAAAKDTSGNYATSSISVIVDNTPPVISSISSGTPGSTSATITWTTNEAADSEVNYGATSAYGSTTTLNATLVTSHSVVISGLSPSTLYHYRVRSTDGAGNLATSSDQSFTTSSTPDTTPPTVAMTAPTNGATVGGASVTLSANASDNVAVAGVTFKVDGSIVGGEDTTPPFSVTWNSTGVADGSHTLVAVARDTSNNLATSSSISVTVDNTAPVISSISSGSPTTTSATITWTTNEAATSKVVYGTTSAYGSATSSASLATSHSIGITGLTASTLYHYAVVSADSVGNTATSSDQTFTTASTPDTTPPTVAMTAPTNGATVGGTSITLTATASDNVAVANVQFKVDSTNIGSAITSSPYTITWNSTGVSDGAHTLYAVAADTSGNYATSSISVTTDNTPPVISSIATSSVATSTAVVTWTTNEAATSQVNYGSSVSYGSATSSASLVTSHSITITGLTASTTYDFQIQSADSVGNSATSSNQTLTTQTGLLGVNISGPEFSPWNGQAFPNSADWSYLASKGVTFVRLPIAWESLQPTLASPLNSTYLGKIESAIASAHAHNIGVIVDLHNFASYCQQADWASSGCGYAGNGGNTGTGVNILGDGTLTQADFTDVWTRLSTALVGTPGLIGYDIMNEPTINILQYGTNLLFAPNGFGDGIGSQPWFYPSNAVATPLSGTANPIATGYGPPWQITAGSGGFGSAAQAVTVGSGTYSLSCDLKKDPNFSTTAAYLKVGSSAMSVTVTSSWTRYSTTTTPGAGSINVEIGVNAGTGNAIDAANCDFRAGSTAATDSTYQPSPWLPYAQAAITAIRGVDASTPIYINGFAAGTAYLWPWVNWELDTLTGGNLVFEAHQYFDGSVSQGGGGGTYGGTYTSYSITTSAGVQEAAPFVGWLASTTQSGYLGEFAIPNSSADNDASWFTLQNLFLQNLIHNNIPAAMWFYGPPGLQPSNILNVATSTTANGGSDDPRLIQMLEQY